MRLSSIVKTAVLALPFVLASCGSHKKVTQQTTQTPSMREKANFIEQVRDNAQTAKFVTSKVKFSVEVGPQKLTLTGNLKMKRDDVIRLQLMAFGFVEAGRIELTKDYVLVMDRINKQYLKAPYVQIDFMRNSGINFNTLQALFWNELFRPNQTSLKKDSEIQKVEYATIESGDDMILGLEEGKMEYSWLVSREDALIRMANILDRDKFNGNSQLNWDYDQFKMLDQGQKLYPHKHSIQLITPKKTVKMGMTMNYIGSDQEWETRTEISNKYREVTVDEILRRFMAL